MKIIIFTLYNIGLKLYPIIDFDIQISLRQIYVPNGIKVQCTASFYIIILKCDIESLQRSPTFKNKEGYYNFIYI